MYAHVCSHPCHIACQKTTWRSWSSPFTVWAMETELRLLALAANVLTHLAGSWRVLEDKLSSKTSHFPPSTPFCYLVSLCSAWVLLGILQKALWPTLTSSGITSLVWVSIGQEIKHVWTNNRRINNQMTTLEPEIKLKNWLEILRMN